MQNASNFDEAIKMLSETKTVTGVYFIVSGTGPNEGCVIEKGREKADNIYCLDENNWYIV